MTDQVDYKQQVLGEIVLVAGDPNATLAEVEYKLGGLYAQHEQEGDQVGMQIINQAWAQIQVMAQQTGMAIDLAAATKVVADEMQQQRDGAVKLHGDLREAVRGQDRHDPDVAKLVDSVFDDAYESAQEELNEAIYSGEAYYSDDPAYDIVECSGIPVAWDVASTFFNLLCSNMLDDISEDVIANTMREELANFMIRFVEKYGVITKAQFESDFPRETSLRDKAAS